MFSIDSHKELVDAVWRMAYIAEYREGGNATHLDRIKGYVQVLGRGLGLDPKRSADHLNRLPAA